MNNQSSNDTLSRYVQIDKWIFEVKSVRAIRVDDFGKPYSAIANFSLNGDSAYIDGLLTREDDDFTREDYQTFVKMTQQLGLKNVSFDRFKQQRKVSDTVKVPAMNCTKPELKLVKA
ncbi:hypothetical protein FGD67_08520 [Colwellia sp. M166]|jgi:hypothetical protein|uniref:hypothetical protein n=1 Tax=Colwellia sp. M166 TaxID=2583805 RepID=UPI00211EE8ED|nr:hypothetical protein [Colwellia sp. M166]UUO23253.1 hypothetical protein FGD67_08520 [Colwellia sp. M166]|tara:strand:- start:1063 stop:1413 length:351 start_codon:yes stop_codon:yes gene_type:complete